MHNQKAPYDIYFSDKFLDAAIGLPILYLHLLLLPLMVLVFN